MSNDLHTLSGAYAIDALSPAEAESFTTHLHDCPSCSEEVAELQEVAARMGASEAMTPPSALRARVLAAADHQPQLRPRVTSVDFGHPRRWSSRIIGAAAAVILMVAVGVGISQLGNEDDPTVAANPVSEVFKAPDAHVATFRTADGHTMKVATSSDSGRMAIDTDSLRKLTSKQVYQLWAVHNGKVTSIGVIEDPSQGKVMPIPTSGTTVAITVEPEGGSKRPTHAPIVQMNPQTI